MATYDNRTYESWRVKCDDRHRRRTFKTEQEANAYAAELTLAGCKAVKVTKYASLRWQVRIRSLNRPEFHGGPLV